MHRHLLGLWHSTNLHQYWHPTPIHITNEGIGFSKRPILPPTLIACWIGEGLFKTLAFRRHVLENIVARWGGVETAEEKTKYKERHRLRQCLSDPIESNWRRCWMSEGFSCCKEWVMKETGTSFVVVFLRWKRWMDWSWEYRRPWIPFSISGSRPITFNIKQNMSLATSFQEEVWLDGIWSQHKKSRKKTLSCLIFLIIYFLISILLQDLIKVSECQKYTVNFMHISGYIFC